MQFMPATWKQYGVDGNQDGYADPVQPGRCDLRRRALPEGRGRRHRYARRVYAYNHADWYVDSVLLRAQVIGGLPTNLVSSLTGLTEGRFPVAAEATYADEVTTKDTRQEGAKNSAVPVEQRRTAAGSRSTPTPARPSSRSATRQVTKVGVSKRLGNYIQVQDAYGNTYTYGRLAKISQLYAAPKPQKVDPAELASRARRRRGRQGARRSPRPSTDAPAAKATRRRAAATARATATTDAAAAAAPREDPPVRPPDARQRRGRGRRPAGVPAHRPDRRRAHARPRARARARPDRHQAPEGRRADPGRHGARPHRQDLLAKHPHLRFEIRPAGRGAPRIDPKPILDGWKLLESTAIYRAKGKNPFSAPTPRRRRSARSC